MRSQPCSDLFISEILFGIDLIIDKNTKNYSIELYNPTDGAIDLSTYSIHLISDDDEVISINLDGILASKRTYVISNPDALAPILARTDKFSLDLDFRDIVILKLMKNGSKVLDKIGNSGPGIPLDEIDLDSLKYPEYIYNININMGSLYNLNLRRDALIREGKPDFIISGDLLNEWALFSSVEIENIGIHECACLQPVIFFYPSDNMTPEEYYPEGHGPIFWDVRITEPLPVDITININYLGTHQFTSPAGVPETSSSDLKYNVNTLSDDLVWVASTASQPYQIVDEVYIDQIDEGFEAGGVWLSILDDNGTGTTVSTTKKFFDFIIFDPLSSVEKITPKGFKIFPTIVTSENNNLQWKMDSIFNIESIKFVHASGVIISEEKCNQCESIEIPASAQKGLIYIQFNTNLGSFFKKILRI